MDYLGQLLICFTTTIIIIIGTLDNQFYTFFETGFGLIFIGLVIINDLVVFISLISNLRS